MWVRLQLAEIGLCVRASRTKSILLSFRSAHRLSTAEASILRTALCAAELSARGVINRQVTH